MNSAFTTIDKKRCIETGRGDRDTILSGTPSQVQWATTVRDQKTWNSSLRIEGIVLHIRHPNPWIWPQKDISPQMSGFLLFVCFGYYNATMKIYVQVLIWMYVFKSLGYILRSGIAELYGKSMFNFWRNCASVSHSGCTILGSYLKKVPISSHSP